MALIPVPLPKDITVERIMNACAGKAESGGGLNLPAIIELAKLNGIDIKGKTRPTILAELCPIYLSVTSAAPAPAAPVPAAPAAHAPIKVKGSKIILKKTATAASVTIKGDCSNLSIFNQVSNICWFHTGAHVGFLSDGMRDLMWTRLFELEKSGDYYIPRKIRKTPVGNSRRPAESLLILEIIRQALEVTAESWAGIESKGRAEYQIYQGKETKVKYPPAEPYKLKRQASADVCDLTVQNFICNLKREWCAPRAGGFAVPMLNTVIKDNGFKEDDVEYPDKFTDYNQSTNVPDANLVSVGDTNGIAILIKWDGTGNHVISFFRCGPSWLLFDNEGTGKRYTTLLENTDKTTLSDLFKAYTALYPKNVLIGYAPYKALIKPTASDIVLASGTGKTADKVENFFTALRDDEVTECLDLIGKYNNMLAPLFGLKPDELLDKLIAKLT